MIRLEEESKDGSKTYVYEIRDSDVLSIRGRLMGIMADIRTLSGCGMVNARKLLRAILDGKEEA